MLIPHPEHQLVAPFVQPAALAISNIRENLG